MVGVSGFGGVRREGRWEFGGGKRLRLQRINGDEDAGGKNKNGSSNVKEERIDVEGVAPKEMKNEWRRWEAAGLLDQGIGTKKKGKQSPQILHLINGLSPLFLSCKLNP